MKKNDNKTQEYGNIFEEYFNTYYTENRDVKNISYREMNDEKGKSIGISAELEYDNFIQYVNVFWDAEAPFTVNACFKFHSRLTDYLCHFCDVLDYYDSDDISCYTYTHCLDKQKTINALDCIMNATKKYWDKLNEIALTPQISQSIFDEVYCDDIDLEDLEEFPLDKVEDSADFTFFTYELIFKRDELKRHLSHLAKKGKLETKFEKRAYRVLSSESYSETKSKEKNRKRSHSFDRTDSFVIGFIFVVFVLVFGAVFAYLGYRLELQLMSEWIGRKHFDTCFAFFGAGAFIGMLVLALIPVEWFKPILPKKRYDALASFEQTQNISLVGKIIISVIVIIIAAFFITFFSLNGIGLNDNQEILYKEYAFSQTQAYSLKDTDIAIVKGYQSKGYNEYSDTAYAFKIDGEWIDYGVPDNKASQIIEKVIKDNGKTVNTYDTVGDIEE